MFAGTDLQTAGVGKSLRLTRTYNSLDAPWGKVSQRWWSNYERYLQVEDDQVVLYDATAGAVTFTKKTDGTYTTPKGYRFDLKKTSSGEFTVTERGSGTKDTYSASGTLVKVTDRNNGHILVDQHDEGSEHKGFKLTDARSGRFIDLVKTDASQWQAKDNTGRTVVYDLNPAGDLTKVTDALGKNRERTYDANLNLETAVDAMGVGGTPGNVTTYGWDTRSNPTTAKLPTGATSALTGYQTIAGADVPGKLPSADGVEVSYTYDSAGNTTKETVAGADGGTRTFAYNPADATCGGFKGQRCEIKDANGKATKFTYDAKGNLTKVTPPSPLGATTYTYDAAGRPETMTDGRGIKTVYAYDQRDRITKVSSTNKTVTYAWDGDGNLKQRSDSTGVTKYDFDPLSRETVRTLQDGSQTVLVYTAEGSVESYIDPSGTVKYAYDKVNRLTSLTDPQGKKTAYEYNANDARTKTTLPSGIVETIARDNSNRAERIKATSDTEGTMIDIAYDYAYTSGGTTKDGTQIRSRTDAVDGFKRSYSYDSAGRLKYAKEMAGSTVNNSWLYCYDKAGNLTSQNGNLPGLRSAVAEDTCPGGTTYTYDDASQLTGKNG